VQNSFRGVYGVVASMASLIGCGETAIGAESDTSGEGIAVVGAVTVELASGLPSCSPERRGAVYFVKSEEQLYYCDTWRYRKLPLPTVSGSHGLCRVEPADLTACSNGGVAISTGVDRDRDGVLDANEVEASEHVCSGLDGADGADGADGSDGTDAVSWVIALEPAPVSECPAGGTTIQAGPDADRDGLPESIATSRTVCNGQPGAMGAPGEDALVERASVIAPGTECEFGGERRERGLDTNGNRELEDVEILPTLSVVVCFVPEANVAGAALELGGEFLRGSDLEAPSPRFLHYTLDFGTTGVDTGALSAQAQRALTPETATSVREAYAIDLLHASGGADLLALAGEIDFTDPAGARCDLTVEIQGREAAVVVSAANVPFDGITADYAARLWARSLDETRSALENLPATRAPDKGVLVIFVSDAIPAQILADAYQALPAAVRGDTIAIVVETLGADGQL